MSKTIYYPLTVSAMFDRTPDGAVFRCFTSCRDAKGEFDPSELSQFFRDFFCIGEPIPLSSMATCKEWEVTDLEDYYDDGTRVDTWLLTKTWTTKDGPKIGYEGNPYPSPAAEIDAELKWSCWSSDEENWGEDWTKLRQLADGEMLRISVSSRKECRGGEVNITKVDDHHWQVDGRFTAYWDSVDDLADTLGQVLVDRQDFERYFKDWDCQSQPVEQLARYLADHYGCKPEDVAEDAQRLQVNDPDAFAESIPFSYHAYDPGVDRDFEFDFEGTLDQLMTRIDQEEDALIADSAQQWNELEDLYRENTQQPPTGERRGTKPPISGQL